MVGQANTDVINSKNLKCLIKYNQQRKEVQITARLTKKANPERRENRKNIGRCAARAGGRGAHMGPGTWL